MSKKENDKEPETKEEGTPLEETTETKTPTAIDVATSLADRIDAGNKKAEELLERQEKLHAEQMLGGHSQAGQAPPEKKELTPEEYADKVMAGETPEK